MFRLLIVLIAITCSTALKALKPSINFKSTRLFSTELKPKTEKVSDIDISQFYDSDALWKIDSDSAEIEVSSSAEKARLNEAIKKAEEAKRKAEEEARKRAEEEAKRLAELEAKKKAELEAKGSKSDPEFIRPTVAAPKPVVSATTESTAATAATSTALTTEKTTGFDIGLLIAFPIMIGTLAFFFLFPFIGEQLSSGSAPPLDGSL